MGRPCPGPCPGPWYNDLNSQNCRPKE
jgi:hypothetical protein